MKVSGLNSSILRSATVWTTCVNDSFDQVYPLVSPPREPFRLVLQMYTYCLSVLNNLGHVL